MTTTAPRSAAPVGRGRLSGLSFGGILRSEWIKLTSLRSTVWAFVVTIAVSLGLTAIYSATLNSFADDVAPAEAVSAATIGLSFGQLAIAVLGVLAVSGEYATGMIRSTLTAVPRRLPALWGKALVLAASTFVVGLVVTASGYLLASALLDADGAGIAAPEAEGVLALVGGAGYLALIALLGLGIGAIVRASAGGVAATVGLLILAPIVFALIPAEWAAEAARFLPSSAGSAMYAVGSVANGELEPWQGLLVLLAWTAVSLGVAASALRRRDV